MSERLRQWMHDRGISNTELANRLGFSRVYVWQVANGRREVTGEFRWRFADLYGWEEARNLFEADEQEQAQPAPEPA